MGNERGSITILLSLIAVVILTIGLGFNWLVREHMRTSEGLREKALGILKARSGYDLLIYLLLTGRITENAVYFNEPELTPLKSVPLDGRQAEMAEGVFVSIQDSNGRLSLIQASPDTLQRLVRNESNASTAAVVTASFIDWIDRDDVPGVNGAEANYYAGIGAPWRPRNYEIQYLSELACIRGMTEGLDRRLLPSLTILPTTGFNPNTAGDAVLKAFLNVDDSGLAGIRNYLQRRTIVSKEDLFRLTGRTFDPPKEEKWFIPSNQMDVVVTVGAPRSLYRIRAGLSVNQSLFYPYAVHYWQEE